MAFLPEFVSAGTAVTGAVSWPNDMTLQTSDLPPGISTGDLLLLLVTVSYSQQTFPTTDDRLGSFAGLNAWTSVPRASFSAGGTVSTGFWQLWAYAMAYDASVFPMSFSPIGETSGEQYTPIRTGGNYRAQMFAWTPPRIYESSTTGTAFNNATSIPNQSLQRTLNDPIGFLVAAACLPSSEVGGLGGEIGAFFVANNFTERHHELPIFDHGGSLKVADYVPAATGSYTGPAWVKPTGPSGVGMLLVFETGGDGDQWGMNTVRW